MVLTVKDLSFAYPDQEPLLKALSTQIQAGTWVALLGPNGSGKTTFLKCLLGLLKAQAGQVLLEGQSLDDLSFQERSRRMAYVPQTLASTFNYRGLEWVALGASHREESAARQLAWEICQDLGIEDLADQSLGQVSGGQGRLLHLAQALAQETSILLLDEPTNHLDYGHHYRFLERLGQLRDQGYTILMTTHAPQDAMDFCDRALILREGRLVAQGSPHQVIVSHTLTQLYQLQVDVRNFDPHYPLQILPRILFKGDPNA